MTSASIAVRQLGEGPPLLLLPAAGRAAADFDPIRDDLARCWRTISLDWPGMGESAPAPEAPSVSSLAALVGDLARTIAEPMVVLGHSVGGHAAIELALAQPSRVRGLVLVDSAGFARVEASRRRPGYAEAVAAVWRSFARPEVDLRSRAAAIGVPTLLVWGDSDPVIPLRAARAAAATIPGATLAVFRCGHTPFLEARPEFQGVLGEFLERL